MFNCMSKVLVYKPMCCLFFIGTFLNLQQNYILMYNTVDWKHKLQSMSCSHALSTKKKVKAPGQEKVP